MGVAYYQYADGFPRLGALFENEKLVVSLDVTKGRLPFRLVLENFGQGPIRLRRPRVPPSGR